MQLFTNNATSKLVAGISNVSLSLQVSAGDGAKFPNPTGGDYFLATLSRVTSGIESNVEIVKVTARATDVFTIIRAQEGTSALVYLEDDFVQLRMTAATATDTEAHKGNTANPHAVTAAQVGAPSGSGTSTGTNTGDQTITLTGGVTGSGTGAFAATVVTNANLTGEVTSVGNATTVTNAAVIGKVLTGYVSGAGTVAATDTILQAINKLNGNVFAERTSTATLTNKTITSPVLTTPTLSTEAVAVTTNNLPALHPSLNLDFANGRTVDPRITFTRASTATRVNSKGLIETVASGVPRIDYDPVTLACKGFLIEEARTNLLTYSEQFDNAAWVKTGTATVTPNTTASPDGTTTADTLNFPASLDRVSRGAIAVSASTPYTFAVWLAGSGTLNITLNTSGGTFKTATQSITLTTTLTRYALSLTTNSDNTGLFSIIGRYDGSAGAGTATSCIAWGAQLEAGAFATSYIPTTSAQVTRAADVATMTSTNFSSWYRADEGTFCVDGGASNDTTSGYAYFASANDATANNAILIAANESGDVINAEVKVSGSVTAGFYPSYTSGSTKIALSYKANDVNGAKDGVAGTTDTSSTLPTVTQLCIGANHAGNQINGHIARIAYYPKRLTNVELQALTA